MKLTELDPRWMEHEGHRIGFVFISPVQHVRSDGTKSPMPYRLTCMFDPTPMSVQREVAERMFGDDDYGVVPCNENQGWGHTCTPGSEFETMTTTPSIDGSASGHWHGHITSGQIVGGLP